MFCATWASVWELKRARSSGNEIDRVYYVGEVCFFHFCVHAITAFFRVEFEYDWVGKAFFEGESGVRL